MTSIFLVGSLALRASSFNTLRRARSPATPFVDPDATTTSRPPSLRTSRGRRLPTSPRSRRGWPALPALNCQQVGDDPSQTSSAVGLGDHPSQPSSGALVSVLTRISLTFVPQR